MCSFQSISNSQATLIVATCLFVIIVCYLSSSTSTIPKEPKAGQKADDNNARMAQTYLVDSGKSPLMGANDVLVVCQADGTLKSTQLHVFVGKIEDWKTMFYSQLDKSAVVRVNGQTVPGITIKLGETGAAYLEQEGHANPTGKFTTSQLQLMQLKWGINRACVVVVDLEVDIPFSIYLFPQDSRLILTDIDGMITKSNVAGFIRGYVGFDVHHDGVNEFCDKVADNGYKVIYLTVRPITLDLQTRKYLFKTLTTSDDGNGFDLPESPLFLIPAAISDTAFSAAEKGAAAKTATLKNIMELFTLKSDVVYGAYGDEYSDTKAYLNIGIGIEKIYLIDKQGYMINIGTGAKTSYKQQSDNIDEVYPSMA